jgi:hypothetical protein
MGREFIIATDRKAHEEFGPPRKSPHPELPFCHLQTDRIWEIDELYGSEQSWKYDWFGPPVYHLHSPGELRHWVPALGLQHLGSTPSLLSKDAPPESRCQDISQDFWERISFDAALLVTQ